MTEGLFNANTKVIKGPSAGSRAAIHERSTHLHSRGYKAFGDVYLINPSVACQSLFLQIPVTHNSSVCPFMRQSDHPSIYLSIYLCDIRRKLLSLYLSNYSCVNLSIYVSTSIKLSQAIRSRLLRYVLSISYPHTIYLPIYQFTHLSIYLVIYLPQGDAGN